MVIDGAEGGTGADPLEFTDHVGTPLVEGLTLVVPTKADRVYNFHQATLKSHKELPEATGVHSPQSLTSQHIWRHISAHETAPLAKLVAQESATTIA